MTKAELIKLLEQFPDDMRVVTPGFDESRYDDVESIQLIQLKLNISKPGHSGTHWEREEVHMSDEEKTRWNSTEFTDCIYINF